MVEELYINVKHTESEVEKICIEKVTDQKDAIKAALGIGGGKLIMSTQAAEMKANSGTFNTLTTYSSSSTNLKNRYSTKSFSNGAIKACQFTKVLPSNYKAGTNIVIRLHWFSVAGTGNARWNLGMTQPTSNNVLGDEAETEYIVKDEAAHGTAQGVVLSTATFDGTGLSAGDVLAFVIVREGSHANDTTENTVHVVTAEIEIET